MNRQRLTLTVVCIATAMLMLDIAVVNTAMPSIGKDLDTGLSGLQWVVDAYTLALAAIVLTAGSVADRLGRRVVFVTGLAVFTASSAACAAAPSIAVLEVARAVQGLGAGLLFATSLAILVNAYPEARERAGAMAVYGSVIGASFLLGPLMGGLLTSGLSWRWVFFVNIPLGIATYVLTRRGVNESKDPHPRRVDWCGQLTLTVGLFLLVLGLLRGNEDGWGSAPIVVVLGLAGAMLVAFVAIEHRVTHPMLPLGFFRNRRFTAAQIAVFGISAGLFSLYIYLGIYLQSVLGLSAVGAGAVFLIPTVFNVGVAGATAQLGERFSEALLVGAGLLLCAGGTAMLLTVDASSSWVAILPGATVAMIGTGLINPVVSTIAMSALPERHLGLAAGAQDTFRQAGIAVGVAGLGALVPAHALEHGNPVAYVDGLHDATVAGVLIAALCGLGAAALLHRRAAAPAAEAAPAPA
jgi:EmrB/QacA subfamily drug resistance transporter